MTMILFSLLFAFLFSISRFEQFFSSSYNISISHVCCAIFSLNCMIFKYTYFSKYIETCYSRLLKFLFLFLFLMNRLKRRLNFCRVLVFGCPIVIEFGVLSMFLRIMMARENLKLHHLKEEM
jgi:hypothetical protein